MTLAIPSPPASQDHAYLPSRSAWRPVAALLIVLVVAGCASRRPAPVEERAAGMRPPLIVPGAPVPPGSAAPEVERRPEAPVPTYTVKRGDTLYQIALDNGLDYRELAAWNNIDNVNLIRVGQVLRLAAGDNTGASTADGVTTAPLRTAPPVTETRPPSAAAPPSVASAAAAGNLKTTPKAIKEPYSDQALRDLTLAATAVPAPPGEAVKSAPSVAPRTELAKPSTGDGDDDDRLDWAWPAKGRVVSGFSETANLKGIDIAGSAGDPVLATAPGKVVYAGSGLRGYGKLIIIKHNKTYLSAYAHNREILVKEGQQVGKGQKIAEMGNSDADAVKLHFEIRRLGKPMDPARYLPPA